MGHRSTAKIFGTNVDVSLTPFELEDVEYRIDSGRENLRMIMKKGIYLEIKLKLITIRK